LSTPPMNIDAIPLFFHGIWRPAMGTGNGLPGNITVAYYTWLHRILFAIQRARVC